MLNWCPCPIFGCLAAHGRRSELGYQRVDGGAWQDTVLAATVLLVAVLVAVVTSLGREAKGADLSRTE